MIIMKGGFERRGEGKLVLGIMNGVHISLYLMSCRHGTAYTDTILVKRKGITNIIHRH